MNKESIYEYKREIIKELISIDLSIGQQKASQS